MTAGERAERVATAVAVLRLGAAQEAARPEDWSAVLIEGPPGAGKSSLALRLIGRGARLIADDRVLLTPSRSDLFASPTKRHLETGLEGVVEAFGLGLIQVPTIGQARAVLICRLQPSKNEPPRLPEQQSIKICQCSLPMITTSVGGALEDGLYTFLRCGALLDPSAAAWTGARSS